MGHYRCDRKPTPRSPLKPLNRSVKRKQWSEEQMITVMEAVQTGTAFSINQAARDYGVPPSTLNDR